MHTTSIQVKLFCAEQSIHFTWEFQEGEQVL